MAIIISKKGEVTQKINESDFELENKMQEYIYDNPDCIPLYEIEEDIKVTILARELGTESGPIDAFGIDQTGNIYLIETKLLKNPDRRAVIAQILDYGAALWKHTEDFSGFIVRLNDAIEKKFKKSLDERLQEVFGLNEEQVDSVKENIKTNLKDGYFKFVILMNKVEDGLKDIIVFINQNSNFNLYAVELDYYKYKDFEITIPKIFGTEVKKNITIQSKRSSNKPFSDEDLFELWGRSEYFEKIKEYLNLCQTYPLYNQDIYDEINKIKYYKSSKILHLFLDWARDGNEYDQINYSSDDFWFAIYQDQDNSFLDLYVDGNREELISNVIRECFPYAEVRKNVKNSPQFLIAKIPLKMLKIEDIKKYLDMAIVK